MHILTLFCSSSASMPRIPATMSIATIKRQTKKPNLTILSLFLSSLDLMYSTEFLGEK